MPRSCEYHFSVFVQLPEEVIPQLENPIESTELEKQVALSIYIYHAVHTSFSRPIVEAEAKAEAEPYDNHILDIRGVVGIVCIYSIFCAF